MSRARDLADSADLSFDGSTLSIDSTNNRVGIGTSSPSQSLHVSGEGYFQKDSADSVVTLSSNGGSGRNWQVRSQSNGDFFVYDGTGGSSSLTIDSSANLKFNSGFGSVATAYGCRAWVNWNGTNTVSVRQSGNVSSITDNGTGDYTINFTNQIDSGGNFIWSGFCARRNSRAHIFTDNNFTQGTNTLRLKTGYVSGTNGETTNNDSDYAYLIVHR